MSTVVTNYASAVAITCTFTSLASSGYQSSNAVDNTSNKNVDALVGGVLAVGAVTADGVVEFYAYASWDGDKYTAGLTGADATITWGTTQNTGVDGARDLAFLGVVNIDTTDDNDDVEFGPFSVAAAFGGTLPPKWGVVVKNGTDTAFNATQSNSVLKYTGIKYDVT